MSFFQKYALVAAIISLVGVFFSVIGLRMWLRLRPNLPWRAIWWHAWKGTGETARSGLYFMVFGGFMVVFALFATGSLALVEFLLVPVRRGFHDELRPLSAFQGPLNWYASGPEDCDATTLPHFVDFAFSYPSDWEVLDPREPGPLTFVRMKQPARARSSCWANFLVAPLVIENVAGRTSAELELDALQSYVNRAFPSHEANPVGQKTIGPYQGRGFDFVIQGKQAGETCQGRAIVLSPTEATRGRGLLILFTGAGSSDDFAGQGELSVLVKSFRFGLEHRNRLLKDF